MNDLLNSSPSKLGYEMLKQYYSEGTTKRLVLLANTGTHRTNPYHNVKHCLSVVYHSVCAAQHGGWTAPSSVIERLSRDSIATLMLAALFHDHSHSGGVLTDDRNIQVAKEFVTFVGSDDDIFFNKVSSIKRLIGVTEYMYPKFTCEPRSFDERCIRDADLCSIYSEEGRDSIIDLYAELGKIKPGDLLTANLVDEICASNRKFLEEAEMYTRYGQHLKATQLSKCLDRFETEIRALTGFGCSYTYAGPSA